MSELKSSGWLSTEGNIKHLAANNPKVKPLATVSNAKKLHRRGSTLLEWEKKYQYTITDLISRKNHPKANRNNVVHKVNHEIVKNVGNSRHGNAGMHILKKSINEEEHLQIPILQTKLASEEKTSCMEKAQKQKVHLRTESCTLEVGIQPGESKVAAEEENISFKTKLERTEVGTQPLIRSGGCGSMTSVGSSRPELEPTMKQQIQSNRPNVNKENNEEMLQKRNACLKGKVVDSSVLQEKALSFRSFNCDQLFLFQRPQIPRKPLKERLSRVY